MKYIALFTAFLASAMIVGEIRTQRSLSCFGCTDVKCVIRAVDEQPLLAISHPAEVIAEFRQTSRWTGWPIP